MIWLNCLLFPWPLFLEQVSGQLSFKYPSVTGDTEAFHKIKKFIFYVIRLSISIFSIKFRFDLDPCLDPSVDLRLSYQGLLPISTWKIRQGLRSPNLCKPAGVFALWLPMSMVYLSWIFLCELPHPLHLLSAILISLEMNWFELTYWNVLNPVKVRLIIPGLGIHALYYRENTTTCPYVCLLRNCLFSAKEA